MYRRILVPVSKSAPASAVLPQAEVLAASLGAEAYVLYTVPLPLSLPVLLESAEMREDIDLHRFDLMEEIVRAEVELAVKHAEVLGQSLRSRGVAARWEVCLIHPGAEEHEIGACARREAVDLVVVAGCERSRLGRLLSPSRAERVAKRVGVPVVLVKAGESAEMAASRAGGNGRIQGATDLSAEGERRRARRSPPLIWSDALTMSRAPGHQEREG